ncbi:MAG: NAD-dependent malic enzyme [Anaerolineaceae bacterium]|nr:NAD-dependent malic enzyme [Anaerolineaceae bacterium]
MKPITKEDALAYHHLNGIPGKLSVEPSKPLKDQRDLSLAYTPGVAYPVLEIEKDPKLAMQYTGRGNLVAVASNGTAILGLGDRGALASKPVMEGKGVLFKKFAGIDVFDLELDTKDPDQIINVLEILSPSFGGINLEDIRSPECFYIEQELQRRLDIPVFHDDQHGTAVILGAALLNALEVVGKRIDQIKIVFSGSGAAGIACATHLLRLGIPQQNIWMCDIAGLIYSGRQEEMFAERERFAQGDRPDTLANIIEDADVFIGLSVADVLSAEMIRKMAKKPIIFPMANPYPEISYELAKATRPDAIVATGRSDYPNQVNNVLGFPFIFRGALDVQARKINNEMKIAASKALADLAKETVPSEILAAYGLDHLEFGMNYIVPKPFDQRVCVWESSAVAEAAIQSGVAQLEVDITSYRRNLEHRFMHKDD